MPSAARSRRGRARTPRALGRGRRRGVASTRSCSARRRRARTARRSRTGGRSQRVDDRIDPGHDVHDVDREREWRFRDLRRHVSASAVRPRRATTSVDVFHVFSVQLVKGRFRASCQSEGDVATRPSTMRPCPRAGPARRSASSCSPARASRPTPASPTSAGPNGVWTKNPAAEKQATLQHYMGDPEVRKQAWRAPSGLAGLDGRAERRPSRARRARARGQARTPS